MAARGAQFGTVNGWERPNYFAPVGFDDRAARGFRRGGWWPHVRNEAQALRERAGLTDATSFAKHVLWGPGATAFLDWFTCTGLPKVGRINLSCALTAAGTMRTEYTILRQAEDRYYLVSAGAWQAYDADYLRKAIADKVVEFGPMVLDDVTSKTGVFTLGGPRSRDILAALIRDPNRRRRFRTNGSRGCPRGRSS